MGKMTDKEAMAELQGDPYRRSQAEVHIMSRMCEAEKDPEIRARMLELLELMSTLHRRYVELDTVMRAKGWVPPAFMTPGAQEEEGDVSPVPSLQ